MKHQNAITALPALVVALAMLLTAAQEDIGSGRQRPSVTPGVRLWTQNHNVIPMCWHELLQFPNPGAANDAKSFVVHTIQDSWISQLDLRITWVDCPRSGSAVHMHVRVKLRSGDSSNNGTTVRAGMDALSTAAQRLVPPPNDPPGLLLGVRSD